MTIEKNAFNIGDQCRIHISRYAMDIIHYDMSVFKEDSYEKFFNRILEMYAPEAKVSVFQRCTDKLDEIFDPESKLEQKAIKLIGNSTKREEKEVLKDKLRTLESEIMKKPINQFIQSWKIDPILDKEDKEIKFKIHNKKYIELTTDCDESTIYKDIKHNKMRPGHIYINCIFEEYASLSYPEREKVFFKNRIKEINNAIKKRKILKIETDSLKPENKIFFVHPCKITVDQQQTANYLTGYSYKPDQTESDKIPCVFRLSSIVSLESVKDSERSDRISPDDEEKLIERIVSHGVQYLTFNIPDEGVVVKFTEEGVRKFHRILMQRPKYDGKISWPNKEYTFKCTTAQAKNYFWRLGTDVEILNPPELREIFRNEYNKGMELYGSSSEEE